MSGEVGWVLVILVALLLLGGLPLGLYAQPNGFYYGTGGMLILLLLLVLLATDGI